MNTQNPRTVKLSISMSDDGQFDFSSAGSSPDTTAHDQCRALMLSIFILCQQTIGSKPSDEVIADLQAWADGVIA
ncbi:hypothetical protein M3F63_07095 [Brachybacterium muris]|uniref:hypothetical protein n=1 Tax=Brachybacterium muris TaxID=219301 RepID=UPI00223B16EA|nr:hypothetical protein [Brachybacterium muris]MCT2177434.1 hypothetical protein [Brachybacterium muris]